MKNVPTSQVFACCPTDRDECSDGSAQCEGECFNVMNGTANSYQCMCGKGFSVSEDQHNCRGEVIYSH